MQRDPAIVSKNMSQIHSKDTSIELQLRKALWHKGYRYRKNYKALPSSPAITLTKYKITDECLQAIEDAIWDQKLALFPDSNFNYGSDHETNI